VTGPIAPLGPPPPGYSSSLSGRMTGDFRRPNDLRHRDALGRPCLDIHAMARPHISMPNIFDHVVVVKNSCLTRIKIKLCYAKADRCFLVEVPGNERREATLGTFAQKFFRFEYQEQY